MAADEDLIHGWHSTHCGRGTSDILWSCLATILLSVWTVIHLPIPNCTRREKGKPVAGEPSRSWKNWIIGSGIVPALISIVAPEFLTMTAIAEFLKAWQRKSKLERLTNSKLTLTHAFFLHMGGFCLETPTGLRVQLEMNDPWLAREQGIETGTVAPDWLPNLGSVTEDQINDHAKSNLLSKLIACGQALWLVTQVISRVRQHKAVTLLEVSTLAYAACALIAYAAWWKKPQNCTLPITISCSAEAISQKDSEKGVYFSEESWWECIWAGQDWVNTVDGLESFGSEDMPIFGLLTLCPAIFGALHLASWNIVLLSNAEQWAWRVSALYCCIVDIIYLFLEFVIEFCEKRSWIPAEVRLMISVLPFLVVSLMYVLLRLFMIFEVFFSLRALPASAYEDVQWSSFVPHI